MRSPAPSTQAAVAADRNPFRVDRIESLAFRPHDPWLTAEAVVQRFCAAGWYGAVVGPHGSGKSTLLRHLGAEAASRGRPVYQVFINRQTPAPARRAALAGVLAVLGGSSGRAHQAAPVIACDGWCHLRPWERHRLRRAAAGVGAGLLGLAHTCGWGLPVVYRTRTTPALFASLVAELHPRPVADASGAVTHRAWHASRGNLRDALLDLYDQHARGT